MQERIETIITRAQQNFEIADGVNYIQIEIQNDRTIDMFKET